VFDFYKKVYNGSPLWLRRLYSSIPYPVRMGRHFRQVQRLMAESEAWSEERLRDFQAQELRRLLNIAFTDVPFYRDWARREGASAEDFRQPEDIRRLPLVTKKLMRDSIQCFTREHYSRLSCAPDSTGGTTGLPFQYLADNASYRREQAFTSSQWHRFGYELMDRKVTLRGRAVANPATNNCWAFNPIHNELNLSIYELTDRTLPVYVDACARYGVRFIHGYISAITHFARRLLDHPDVRVRLPRFTAIFGCSEAVMPGQRETIEEAFGCRLFSWYGMTERVIWAGECEGSTLYHCLPQYGITELVDAEGRLITEPGIDGELVGTGFNNTVVPFIRYRMGDFASWAPGRCEHCRRGYPLLNGVRGRAQDYLVGSDGRLITMTAVTGAIHGPEYSRVDRFQFYQDTPGKVELRILPTAAFDESDAKQIRHTLEGKLGPAFELTLTHVDAIPLTTRGKELYLIQKIPISPAS